MASIGEKLDYFLVKFIAYFNYRNYAKKINIKKNENILEVGCGGGNLSRFLAKKLIHGKLVCVDNSEYWIKNTKKRLNNFENIEFLTADIQKLGQEKCFDKIVLHYVLHDITEKDVTVCKLIKMLKPKGIIFIREPTRKNHGMNLLEIENLMVSKGLKKLSSKESYSFPLRGKIYEGVFVNY